MLFDVWYVPLMLTGWMTAVRDLSEHGVTDTRDLYLSWFIEASHPVRFFILNQNYHVEHHPFPEIPGLPCAVAHQLIVPNLPRTVTMTSCLGFLFGFFAQSLRVDNTPIGINNWTHA